MAAPFSSNAGFRVVLNVPSSATHLHPQQKLTDDAEIEETVDELAESTADLDLDESAEFEITRSASI